MASLIPVTYHKKKYPHHIRPQIQEIAGHFDKTIIVPDASYSLHTEYSYMSRRLDTFLISDLFALTTAQKNGIPCLWFNSIWAEQFYVFLERLINKNVSPEVLEIHPPFTDYCPSIEQFIEYFNLFDSLFHKKNLFTKILIENRYGTLYRGGRFLFSTCSDILALCSAIKKTNTHLKVVLDYPQLMSAEQITPDSMDLTKILVFNEKIKEFKDIIGGFHLWGKRKSKTSTRWVPHSGDLNSLFDDNIRNKHIFLQSIREAFNDNVDRYFVPEVNSKEEDLLSIITDMENEGFVFNSNT